MTSILQRMRGRFARREDATQRATASGTLGVDLLALRLPDGAPAPPGAMLLYVDGAAAGAGRLGAGRAASRPGESAWALHPGPYRIALAPFAAAAEVGLQLDLCIDPSGDLARFALYLAAECSAEGARLPLSACAAGLQGALQCALQQATLELPPCCTDEEWQAFRAGLDELVFTRFGLIVEDCVPADLHPQVDLAQRLQAQPTAFRPVDAVRQPSTANVITAAPPATGPLDEAALAGDDAHALRRLFLELPALSAGLRALDWPAAAGGFAGQQATLRRLALATLEVNTMPSLSLAAPGRTHSQTTQARRAAHTRSAVNALDEGWALLAMSKTQGTAALKDEADRILSNLEYALAQRRESEL